LGLKGGLKNKKNSGKDVNYERFGDLWKLKHIKIHIILKYTKGV